MKITSSSIRNIAKTTLKNIKSAGYLRDSIDTGDAFFGSVEKSGFSMEQKEIASWIRKATKLNKTPIKDANIQKAQEIAIQSLASGAEGPVAKVLADIALKTIKSKDINDKKDAISIGDTYLMGIRKEGKSEEEQVLANIAYVSSHQDIEDISSLIAQEAAFDLLREGVEGAGQGKTLMRYSGKIAAIVEKETDPEVKKAIGKDLVKINNAITKLNPGRDSYTQSTAKAALQNMKAVENFKEQKTLGALALESIEKSGNESEKQIAHYASWATNYRAIPLKDHNAARAQEVVLSALASGIEGPVSIVISDTGLKSLEVIDNPKDAVFAGGVYLRGIAGNTENDDENHKLANLAYVISGQRILEESQVKIQKAAFEVIKEGVTAGDMKGTLAKYRQKIEELFRDNMNAKSDDSCNTDIEVINKIISAYRV